MKTYKLVTLLFLSALTFTSCSDDDRIPEPINEEEVITTVIITLESSSEENVIFTSQDLDGDGPDEPTIKVEGTLMANTIYNGTLTILNETVFPAEEINEEIEEEADKHQFFFEFNGFDATTAYLDTEADYNGGSDNPVGLKFILNTGEPSTGTFTITLRHEPDKNAPGVANGDISNAGGETDVQQTFDISSI